MGWNPLESVVDFATETIGFALDQKENNKNRSHQDATNQANYEMQKEFAMNGIRWKAEDARQAGIHPLAAMGAQGYQASPSHVSSPPDYSAGNAVRNFGQDISRSINSTMTPEERTYKALQVESLALDNAMKKKELEGFNSPGLPSNSALGSHLLGANPLNYHNQSAYVQEDPTRRSHSATGKPYQAAGNYNDYVFAKTATGLHPVPSKEMQEAIEDKFIPETLWSVRNYLHPTFSPNHRKLHKPSLKDHPLPPGYDWEWKPVAAEWRPYKQKGRTLWQKFMD